MKILLISLTLVLLAVILYALVNSYWYWRSTSQMVEQLQLEIRKERQPVFSYREIERLPEPLQRYFRLVLREKQPYLQYIRLIQRGEFRLSEDEETWYPLEAEQFFKTQPPEFIWKAEIGLFPLLSVYVRDHYRDGRGSMFATLSHGIVLLNETRKAELNSSSLMRFLSEAVWFPTALLPGEHLRWEALDEHTARAIMEDHGIHLEMDFHFNEKGETHQIIAQNRYREVQGKYYPTPWRAQLRDYQELGGVKIPVDVEAAWLLPGRELTYFRAKVTEIQFDDHPLHYAVQ